MVESREDFGNCGRVGDHANCSHDFGEVSTRNDGRWLVVNTTLEASGAPVDELNSSLGFDGSNCGVDVLGNDISTVHHAASHVLSVSRIALGLN